MEVSTEDGLLQAYETTIRQMHVLLSPGAPYVPGTPATEQAVDVLRRLLEQCPDPVFADEEAQPGAADTTGIPVLCPDQMRRHWEAAVRHGGTPAQPSAFPTPGTFGPGADKAQEEETVGTPQLLRQWTAHSEPRGLTGTPPQLNPGPSSPSRPGTAALEPYGGFFRNPIETSLSREGNRENETRSVRNEAVFIQQDEPRHSRSGTTPLRLPGEEDSGNMQQGQNNLSALSAIDVVRSPSIVSFCDAAPFDSDLESRQQQQEDRQEAAALDRSDISDLPLPVDRSAADHEEESFVERMVERSGVEHQVVLDAPSTTAGGDEEEKEERHQGEEEEEKEDLADAAPQPRGTSRRQDGGYRIRTAPAASAAAAAATAADSAPPAGDRGPERSLNLGNRDPHGRRSFQEKEEEEVGGNGTDRRAPSRACNGLKRCRGVIGCCCAPCRCCCCCCSREGTEEEQEEEHGCEEALTSHGSRKQRCRGRSRPVEVSVRLSGDGSAVVVEVPGSSGGSSPGLQQITLRPVTTGSTGLPETSHLGGYTDSQRAEEGGGGGGEEGRQQEGPGHCRLGGSTRSFERQLDLSNHDATSGALMALLGRKGEGSSAQQGGASCDLSRALLKACRPPPGPSSA